MKADDFWVGMTDREKEDTWVWESGIPLANDVGAHWKKDEPNDAGGNEDCARYSDGGLNDIPCGGTSQVVCQRGRLYHSHRKAVKI